MKLKKYSKNLPAVLTVREQKQLIKLGKKIVKDLSCNLNDTGMPCRTCRLAAVELMQKYFLIHI